MYFYFIGVTITLCCEFVSSSADSDCAVTDNGDCGGLIISVFSSDNRAIDKFSFKKLKSMYFTWFNLIFNCNHSLDDGI